MKKFIFVTGASGVGKTTLIQSLQASDTTSRVFLNFDDIGVPSYEEMIQQYGSGEERQRQMTHRWLEKIVSTYTGDEIVLLEGSVRFSFVEEGIRDYQIQNATMILLDADEATITRRLSARGHPELVTPEMFNWLRYLREQALSVGVQIINTSERTIDQVREEFITICSTHE